MAIFVLLAAGAMFFAMQLDRWVFHVINNPDGLPSWLVQSARLLGEMPTWIIATPLVAFASFILNTRRSLLASFERSLLIIWAPMLAGFCSTTLKLLLRRERPDAHDGAYVFRPWNELPFDTSGLGLPSGHASVAFGAAFMLMFMFPRLGPLWLFGAILCGLTRLMPQAHFFSDVIGGAILGFASAWLMWSMYLKWFNDREPVILRILRMMQRQSSLSPVK